MPILGSKYCTPRMEQSTPNLALCSLRAWQSTVQSQSRTLRGPPPCRRQASPAVSRRASKGSPVRIASIVKSVLAYPCEPFAYGQIVRAHPSLPYPVSWRLTCTSDTQSARHGLRCRPPDRCICQGVRCHCPGGTRLPSVALFFASCVASCFIPVNLPGRKNAPIEERFLSHVGHVH